MARYYGKVGFIRTEETSPGVFTDVVTERNYYGDVLSTTVRWSKSEDLNDNFGLTNQISIVADDFALANFSIIKYIEWMGILWKVASIEVKYPRLIIRVGGEYNEEQADASDGA